MQGDIAEKIALLKINKQKITMLIFSQVSFWPQTLKTEVLALDCGGHVHRSGVGQGCCGLGSV